MNARSYHAGHTMRLRCVRSSPCTTRICFRFEGDRPAIGDFAAEPGETAVRYESKRCVVYAGLGKRDKDFPHRLRTAAAAAVQRVAALKRTSAALVLDSALAAHEPAVEGALLGAYVFDRYLSSKPERIRTLDVVSSRLTARGLRAIQSVCGAVCYARDLVNDNAGIVTPAYLVAQARRIGRAAGMRVEVLDHRRLRARGLNLLSAVGQGSVTPPHLALVHYRGNPSSGDITAVVGKGITFDTGGLNLKPSGHIETMRIDMAGAAAVLGVMRALGELRPKINVTGVCALAHNAIDGGSYHPGDVIRAYNGTTVEICNTDAEGRLALADAVAYTRERVKPSRIIDLATLTGGILTTFADVLCGLFATDDRLAEALLESGLRTHERLWRLPLHQEFCDAMKGDRSDLRSLAKFKRGHASSITGAAFIKAFAGDTPWAHLDIAGTAFNEGEARGDIPKYATGFGVRLLIDYLTGSEGAGRSRRQ